MAESNYFRKWREERSKKGLVYFSCQVTPAIKEKLTAYLNKLRKKHKI